MVDSFERPGSRDGRPRVTRTEHQRPSGPMHSYEQRRTVRTSFSHTDALCLWSRRRNAYLRSTVTGSRATGSMSEAVHRSSSRAACL